MAIKISIWLNQLLVIIIAKIIDNIFLIMMTNRWLWTRADRNIHSDDHANAAEH